MHYHQHHRIGSSLFVAVGVVVIMMTKNTSSFSSSCMRCIRGSGSTRSNSSGNNFMSRTQQKIPRGGCSTSLSWNYHDHRYHQHLRQQPYQQYHQHSCRLFASVTGTVYTANSNNNSNNANGGKSNGNNNGTAAVVITLYTKEGCTLCDQVKDVLQNQLSHTTHPHTLQQIDITDTDQQYYYDRYKYGTLKEKRNIVCAIPCMYVYDVLSCLLVCVFLHLLVFFLSYPLR